MEQPHGIALVVLGMILVPLSVSILWKNETRAVALSNLVSKVRKACVDADSDAPHNDNDKKLVHISGISKSKSIIQDK